MSRYFESRRTHSGYAEISGGRAKKKTTKPCKMCGADVKFWRGQHHNLQRQHGELKAMFRANMLRAIWPEGVNVNAEIDRVLAEIEK